MLFLGLLGFMIYFISRSIRDILTKHINKTNFLYLVAIILMTITLYAKYCYFAFWDYPALIITPVFILVAVLYFKRTNEKDYKLMATSVLYVIMIIPLFGIKFHGAPRKLFPQEWYDRFDIKQSTSVNLPYKFKFKETSDLRDKANSLKNKNNYSEAINIYHQAMKIEPNNEFLYFDISECYARENHLEEAILLLDTAIMFDQSQSSYFNNRGLIYYKLKENTKAINDYLTAIKLDSTQSSIFANLALVYYYQKQFKKACEAFEKAKQLGLDAKYAETVENVMEGACR